MRLEASEQAATPRRAPPVWMLALGVGLLILLWCLISDDAVIPNGLGFAVLEADWKLWCIFLAIGAVFFGIQWGLLRLKRARWTAWLPICLFVLGLIYGEIVWSEGGWNRLGAGFICAVLLPACVGAALAAGLRPLLRQKKSVKIAALALVLVLVGIAVWLWPKPLSHKLLQGPVKQMLYTDVSGTDEWMEVTDSERCLNALGRVKVSPCYSAPPWRSTYRSFLVRLDDAYILMAPCNAFPPYIYRYSDPLEDFDGSAPRWLVYDFSDLYGEFRMSVDWP